MSVVEPVRPPILIIRADRRWWDLRLSEVWRYRDLIRLLVWRDFVAYYKQTVLGPLWYFIQPILTTVVFTVVFGNIAHLSTDGIAPFLFYLAGNTLWSYFSACLLGTSNTFTVHSAIFGKVYFPRLCVPISVVVSNLISFAIRFAVFAAFWGFYLLGGAEIYPNGWLFAAPALVLIMAGLGLGFGIMISSMTTKYRDLQQLLTTGMALLMYTTPIIYPLSTVQGAWRWLILANPMTPVVEVFRLGFLGTSAIEPVFLLYSLMFTLLTLLIGTLMFNRVESMFMDTV